MRYKDYSVETDRREGLVEVRPPPRLWWYEGLSGVTESWGRWSYIYLTRSYNLVLLLITEIICQKKKFDKYLVKLVICQSDSTYDTMRNSKVC